MGWFWFPNMRDVLVSVYGDFQRGLAAIFSALAKRPAMAA